MGVIGVALEFAEDGLAGGMPPLLPALLAACVPAFVEAEVVAGPGEEEAEEAEAGPGDGAGVYALVAAGDGVGVCHRGAADAGEDDGGGGEGDGGAGVGPDRGAGVFDFGGGFVEADQEGGLELGCLCHGPLEERGAEADFDGLRAVDLEGGLDGADQVGLRGELFVFRGGGHGWFWGGGLRGLHAGLDRRDGDLPGFEFRKFAQQGEPNDAAGVATKPDGGRAEAGSGGIVQPDGDRSGGAARDSICAHGC